MECPVSADNNAADRYAELLTRALANGTEHEEDLQIAYGLGRSVVEAGEGMLDLVAAHHRILAALAGDAAGVDEARVARAGEVLTETLAASEMAFRGFLETHDRLVEARAEAERANRAKDEFLSRTSHELRTPLNAILGFGQLLELDGLAENQVESVALILRAARHLLDLINEVLDISRIESGRLGVSIEPVQVGELAKSALALMRPLAVERGISLDLHDDEACHLYVNGDRQRVQQILINLISNGIKYNRRGGSVVLSCAPGGEGHLRFTVADTGRGLTAAQLERIFAPFDRLGAETSGIEGTGLGLTLAKSLSEAMGGDLRVDSEVGVGTLFLLELPKAEGQAADRGPEPAPTPVEEPVGRELTILYIEDNLSNVKLVEMLLRRWRSVNLLSALEGRMGLELAHQYALDLILLDLHLPDAHGSDVLVDLKDDPGTAGVPVVVISADATPGQIERLLDLGAAEYLTKPFDVRAFVATLDRLLPSEADG
jgi:signal transduction histidine kinase/ActR/RegA family two-component response regulator